MTPKAIKELITRRVAEALAVREANCNLEPIVESESENGEDDRNSNSGGKGNSNVGRNGNSIGGQNGNDTKGGNGNYGNNNGNGNRNGMNGGGGGFGPVAKFGKIESVYLVSKCPMESQLKFATCTLLYGALTWWNSYMRTIGINEVYVMSRNDLMKVMIEVYCPRNKIQKLENELWNLCVKGTDIVGYTRNVASSQHPRLQDAIKMANSLMDQKFRAYAARNLDNKRMFKN
nr:hypothetical protein [Tanacetum cinerariifolium]